MTLDDYYFYKINNTDICGNSDNSNSTTNEDKIYKVINNYSTPLAIAVINDYYDIAFLLLHYGANPNKKYGIYEKNLLHVCV